MSVLQITLVVAIIFIILWHLSRRKFVTMVNKFPGPPAWPIIGNAGEFFINHQKVLNLFCNYYEKWPKYFRIWLGTYPMIFLTSAKAVEAVLSSSTLIDKANLYLYLHPWLGTGLLTSTGQKWQSRRKLLTPSFHFRIVDDFMPIFNEQADIFIEILNQNVNKSSFDIYPVVTLLTLDIICESVMGVHVNAQINCESSYVEAMERIKDIVHSRMIKAYMWPELIFNMLPEGRDHAKCLKILHGFTEKVIADRKISLKEKTKTDIISVVNNKKKRLAFLDLLLEASNDGKNLSDLDIREEVDTFLFEGHDTTAVGISWTIFLLGNYPDVQKRVQEELDSIFGDDTQRHATSDDLRRMKYLDCVIKESQRLFPSVPIIARQVNADTTIDGMDVPSGVTVLISTYLLHRDKNVFQNPENFDPSRFFPENLLNRNPFAHIPFSAGPRNCIGQKFAVMILKVVLSSIFRNFIVESLVPQNKIKLLSKIVHVPKYGIQVRLTPRYKKTYHCLKGKNDYTYVSFSGSYKNLKSYPTW